MKITGIIKSSTVLSQAESPENDNPDLPGKVCPQMS